MTANAQRAGPRNEEGAPAQERPSQASALTRTDTSTPSVTDGYDVAAGLRRRREAALRLPPLDCGCRDPETIEHIERRCRWRRRETA